MTTIQNLPHTALSIIIPEYNPDMPRFLKCLSSISNQLNVNPNNFNVIVVNDCDKKPISNSFFDAFPNLSIILTETEKNGGPGVARQCGIDICNSDYVMFIDCDDRLYSPLTLTILLNEIYKQYSIPDTNKWDVLITNWLEETLSQFSVDKEGHVRPDQFMYVPHDNDGTWMHGKVFRKAFLNQYNIRFNELRVHEDRCFNMKAFALANAVATLNTNERTYLWTYNPQSIVRRDNAAYSYNSMDIAIEAAYDAYSFLLDNYKERSSVINFNRMDLKKNHRFNLIPEIGQNIFYLYFVDQAWTGKVDQKYINALEKSLAKFCHKFINYYSLLVDRSFTDAYCTEREISAKQMGSFIEREDFKTFLARILKTYPAQEKPYEITEIEKR